VGGRPVGPVGSVRSVEPVRSVGSVRRVCSVGVAGLRPVAPFLAAAFFAGPRPGNGVTGSGVSPEDEVDADGAGGRRAAGTLRVIGGGSSGAAGGRNMGMPGLAFRAGFAGSSRRERGADPGGGVADARLRGSRGLVSSAMPRG
jgi:hypothetical protein